LAAPSCSWHRRKPHTSPARRCAWMAALKPPVPDASLFKTRLPFCEYS
jgi:hypothetical protein